MGATGTTPGDLGLPEAFSSWREGQWEAICAAFRSKAYAFLLDAPTGIGKTIIGAGLQKMMDRKAVYCCVTKSLQEQFLRDFPYAKLLKGRSNYPCLKYKNLFPQVTAEHCTHNSPLPCELADRCPYMVAKREALRAPLAVLNTSYFLSEANWVGGFSEIPLLILDEVDTVENQLMSFVSVVITKRQLDSLKVNPPKYKTKFEAWVDWARPVLKKLKAELMSLEAARDDAWFMENISTLRRTKSLERLVSKLQFFVKEVNDTWVWYPGEDRWEFKPVWIGSYGPLYLWKHALRVLGMSGTILNPSQLSRNIGLNLAGRTYIYHRLRSPFPKEHRPIYYKPVANLTYKTMKQELPKVGREVQAILDKHPDDHILVHTVSYATRNYLMSTLTPKSRLTTHNRQDAAQKLLEFKSSPEPLVMLSPAMDRGVDLPDNDCRVVVVAKIPYPSLGDPQVKKRVYASKDGNLWFAHRTACSLIQMCGRAVRSKNDHAETYILDKNFERLYDDYKGLFPSWWREALVEL